MRYEVIRVSQFLFALLLIGGAFAAGLFVGWARWGPRRSAVPTRSEAKFLDGYGDLPTVSGRVAPGNLFAPESSLPSVVVVGAEELIDLRVSVDAAEAHVVGSEPIALGPAFDDIGGAERGG